jgi:hypothetical protein
MISTGFVIGVGYQFFTKESNSILKYVCNCIYNISNVKFEDDKLMLKIYIYMKATTSRRVAAVAPYWDFYLTKKRIPHSDKTLTSSRFLIKPNWLSTTPAQKKPSIWKQQSLKSFQPYIYKAKICEFFIHHHNAYVCTIYFLIQLN